MYWNLHFKKENLKKKSLSISKQYTQGSMSKLVWAWHLQSNISIPRSSQSKPMAWVISSKSGVYNVQYMNHKFTKEYKNCVEYLFYMFPYGQSNKATEKKIRMKKWSRTILN